MLDRIGTAGALGIVLTALIAQLVVLLQQEFTLQGLHYVLIAGARD